MSTNCLWQYRYEYELSLTISIVFWWPLVGFTEHNYWYKRQYPVYVF